MIFADVGRGLCVLGLVLVGSEGKLWVALLRNIGATQQTDIQRGLGPKVESLFRNVERERNALAKCWRNPRREIRDFVGGVNALIQMSRLPDCPIEDISYTVRRSLNAVLHDSHHLSRMRLHVVSA